MATKPKPLRPKRWPLEIRRNADDTLDEIVCDGASIHLEQMSGTSWWLSVRKGKKEIAVWFNSTRKITTHDEDRSD